MIVKTPPPPYYTVIFTSTKTNKEEEYLEMSDKMLAMASKQKGFLGVESARETIGITVSYWSDLDAIKKWKENASHKVAREKGRENWYQSFSVRIAKVERDYFFDK